MKEYIEKEKLFDCLDIKNALGGHYGISLTAINSIPAADVAEVRHGRWIDSEEDGHLSICGVCNYPVDRFYKTKYCPNCGAKMDGGVNDAAD